MSSPYGFGSYLHKRKGAKFTGIYVVGSGESLTVPHSTLLHSNQGPCPRSKL